MQYPNAELETQAFKKFLEDLTPYQLSKLKVMILARQLSSKEKKKTSKMSLVR